MKKYIKDLTYDELKELIEYNDDIAQKASERAESDVRFWAEEYLAGIPNDIDYTLFDTHGADDFKIDEFSADVVDWLKEQTKTFGLLDDASLKKLDRIQELQDLMEDAYYDEPEKYDEYESEYEDLKMDIEEN